MIKRISIIFLIFVFLVFSTTSCTFFQNFIDLFIDYPESDLTDSSGVTTITINDTDIHVTVQDDSGSPVEGIEVQGTDLGNGKILVWAEDPEGENYFTDYQLINSNQNSERSVTATFVVMAVISVGLVVYDYVSGSNDMPIRTVAELDESGNVEKHTVLSVDLSDVLNIVSLVDAGTTCGKALLVKGAPATARGAAAMKYGFTSKKFQKMANSQALEQFFLYDLNTFLSEDLISFTFYQDKSNDSWIPIVKIDVDWKPDTNVPEYTFSLKWAEYPKDLDAYLFYKKSGNSWSDPIYFGNKGSKLDWPFIVLDNDERHGYGPENVAIWNFTAGDKYHYFVHNYSDGEDGSDHSFTSSPLASVIVLKKRQIVDEFVVNQATGDMSSLYWNIGYIEKNYLGEYHFHEINRLSNQVPVSTGDRVIERK